MAIFNKTKPIPEQEAVGETERIYYEIRQILRSTGVPQLFCSWAGHGQFLPLVWSILQPNAGTRLYEEASDRLRAEGARLIKRMEKPDVSSHVRLGRESNLSPSRLPRSLSLSLPEIARPDLGGPKVEALAA